MIKLKKIVSHLSDETYSGLEQNLLKNKSGNFLFLLRAYRSKKMDDPEIAQELGISANSLYVLKSRLNDKIQEELSGNLFQNREDVIKSLHRIPEMLYGSSGEVAEAYLEKLEADLLGYDMHSELLVVYSALKRLHLYSDKYFHFSQSYNRHVAFNLSVEKALEILGNFNRYLSIYDFSRNDESEKPLTFLHQEVRDHFALNPSRQIELISNLIELQLAILGPTDKGISVNSEELLIQTQNLINGLPAGSSYKKWKTAHDFLAFEYYLSLRQYKNAKPYFDVLEEQITDLLLFSHVCLVSNYLVSRIVFAKAMELSLPDLPSQMPTMLDDRHTEVYLDLSRAMWFFQAGDIKKAAFQMNAILNNAGLKDLLHINVELKLTLSYFYILMEEFDLAENILKNLQRKLKSEDELHYPQVKHLIKLFTSEAKTVAGKISERQKELWTLFDAKNKGKHQILHFLESDLKKRYT